MRNKKRCRRRKCRGTSMSVIFKAPASSIMHSAWSHALKWYQRSQRPEIRRMSQGCAILSNSGNMAHALFINNRWMLISNPWFKQGVPSKLLDRIVAFLQQQCRGKCPATLRAEVIDFYRKTYIATIRSIAA